MEGTYPLPEAQVDRFFFKLYLQPPALGDLEEIIRRNTAPGEAVELAQSVSREALLEARAMVEQFPIAESLLAYAARLVQATHPDEPQAPALVQKYVAYGASPRAGISLVAGAKAHAFLNGAHNVRMEDLRAVFPLALNHRVLLNFKAQSEGITVTQVLDRVVGHVKAI
jgi:MoxR-like ATPase